LNPPIRTGAASAADIAAGTGTCSVTTVKLPVQGLGTTDYSGDGQIGQGDVRIDVDNSPNQDTFPVPISGLLKRFADLRANPPGTPTQKFDCRKGSVLSFDRLAPKKVAIHGEVGCKGLGAAKRYDLTITDGGKNPPNQDTWHMVLYDANDQVLYDQTDLTTVGMGNLSVLKA
jgi:hypothetical protein